MVTDDFRPIKYVARRAYELALTGEHEDFASIEAAIVDEGYAEYVAWLEVPGVMTALGEICIACRWQSPPEGLSLNCAQGQPAGRAADRLRAGISWLSPE